MHPHLFDLNQEMHEITPVILITNTKVEKKYLNLLIDIAKKISKKKIILLSKKNLFFDSNKISFYRLKSRSVINRKFIVKKLKSINIKTYILLNYNYPFRSYKEIKRAIAIFKEKKINLISATVSPENPYKMWHFSNKKIKTILRYKKVKESHSVPRQILPITYIENGCFEIIDISYKKQELFISEIPYISLSNNSEYSLKNIMGLYLKNKKYYSSNRLPS